MTLLRSFSHLMSIEKPARMSDFTREEESWEKVGEAYFSIMPIKPEEIEHLDKLVGKTTHRLKTHWRTDITPEMRLRKGERIFHVVQTANFRERNRVLELVCVEVAG